MKSIEQLLINNEVYIRKFFDGIPLPVYAFQKKDKDFICIDHNTKALSMDQVGFKIKLGTKASKTFKSYPQILKYLAMCIAKKKCFSHDIEVISETSKKYYLQLKYGYIPSDLVLLHIEDVTEKSVITNKLRESEVKLKDSNIKLEARVKARDQIFQNIIETIPDLFFITSNEGIIIDFIGNVDELYIPSEEFMGKSILEIFPQEVSVPIYEMIKKTIKTKKLTTYEYSLPMKNQIRHYEIRNLFFSEKRVACFIRDISQRKKNELKLIEERQKYEKLISNIPDVIYYTIHKDNFSKTFMSKRWEEWSGYSSEDLMKDPMIWTKSIHPDDLKNVIQNYYIASKNKEDYTIEYRILHKNTKRVTYVRDHGSVIKDMRETITRYDGILTDITQEKLAQKQLEINEKRYHLILENLNDMIYIINQNLQVEYINESVFKKLLGYNKTNFINQRPLDNIHPDDLNKALIAIKKGIRNTEGNVKLRIKDIKDRYHYHELTGKLFIDYDGLHKALIISRDINDQIKLEEELMASEEKYRIIAENAIDIIGIINDKYVIEYVNKIPLKKIAGYDLKDILGRKGLDFIHPDDREKTLKSLLKGIKKGEDRTRIRFMHKDGHYLWTESAGSVYKDIDGNLKGIIIIRDISTRKKIEEKLKKSEERYRLISENANDMIAVINKNLKLEFTNSKPLKRILGYELEEILFKNLIQFIHPTDLKMGLDALKKGSFQGHNKVELRFKHKDGTYKWLEIGGQAFEDVDGEYKGILVSRDITERKKGIMKIKKSEETLRKFIESSYDGIVLTDEKGLAIKWNNALEKITGLKREEVLKKPVWEIMYSSLPDFLKRDELKSSIKIEYEEALKGKPRPWLNKIREVKLERPNKEVRIIQQLTFIMDTISGYRLGSICRDVTEIKNFQDNIAYSEKKYREAYDRANFYKDLFAHDISNILQIVNSSAEMLEIIVEKTHDYAKMHNLAKMIQKQILRGTKLVNNVHTLSVLENEDTKLKPINIYSVLLESINNIKKMYDNKKIEVKLESTCKKIMVNADEHLKQVFENILINSIKYNDKELVKVQIKISKYEKDSKNFIKMEFIDNGIGVRDDRKKEIFKRGNRELKGTKGMGIGLSLVKEILRIYNSNISVEDRVQNDYSKGSKFVILMPHKNYLNTKEK